MKLVHDAAIRNATTRELRNKAPLRELYKDMMGDLGTAQGTLGYTKLWSTIAPTGNIYRFCGLVQERLRHCADLGAQMDDLAEEFGPLLGGAATPLVHRREQLMQSLQRARVMPASPKASLEDGGATGFLPLLEFVETRTVRRCWTLCLEDSDAQTQLCKRHVVAAVILVVQILSPIFMFVHKWHGQTNYMRDPAVTWQRMSWVGIRCEGRKLEDWATIFMGALFMVLVLTQLLHYAQTERENAKKLGRLLPQGTFWLVLGDFANTLCLVSNIVLLPALFWAMRDPTEVIVGALGVLFVFTLDDFCGFTGAVLNISDEQFQRAISWNYALLSQCPVVVRDLINPEATSAENLWRVEFDGQGLLLAARGARGSEGSAPVYCATRIAHSTHTESSPLLGTPARRSSWVPEEERVRGGFAGDRVRYRTSVHGGAVQLPGWRSSVQEATWLVIVCMLHVLRLVLPPLWVLVNKPCAVGHAAGPGRITVAVT